MLSRIILLSAALISSNAVAEVDMAVIDGDTVIIDGERVNLYQVDAPPLSDACVAAKLLGAMAKRELSWLLSVGEIKIERKGIDKNGRSQASVFVDGKDVGVALVDRGFAVRLETEAPETEVRVSWCN